MRLFFHIAYDGSSYSGWQRQPNSFTVQEVLEQKLQKIFKEPITVFGCGRTDKGVHASQYFFHINIQEDPTFDLTEILRHHLPSNISLFEIIKLPDNSHTRYDAIKRAYDYFIHFHPDPFLDKYSTLVTGDLNIELMFEAAALIEKYENFKSFCIQPGIHNHTYCKIKSSQLLINEKEGRMVFSIIGDRFLKGMIRIIVENLLKVGREEITVNEFEYNLINPVEVPNLKRAAPNGLYLSKVEYPYLERPNSSTLFKLLKAKLN